MAPPSQKSSASKPVRLALLTALSVAGTLMYVFVLLVPAWRTVTIDRALIGAFLANHSSDADAQLWDALARDPLLRSRSANAFRECALAADGGRDGNATAGGRGKASAAPVPATMERHLLELLAGESVKNTTTTPMATTATTTTTATPPTTNSTGRNNDNKRPRDRSPDAAAVSDRCWFLNLHWSEGNHQTSNAMTVSHRALLHCTRALFILAVCLLLCYCVGLTGALYGCFATRLARSGRMLLLAVHCLALSQLVAVAILQDASAGLAWTRLRDLLAAAGFPDGCAAAVDARQGVCSLALLCVLCLVSAVHMLLLLLPMSQEEEQQAGKQQRQLRYSDQQHPTIVAAGAGADREDGEKMRECDDTDDTNPLI